jgi:hypothetical protein
MAGIFNIELAYRAKVETLLSQGKIDFEMFIHKRRDCIQIQVADKNIETMARLLMKLRTTI